MKYIYECEFKDKPECRRCMLSRENYDGEHFNCMALGSRPICPEEGCCRKDCPLKLVKEES